MIIRKKKARIEDLTAALEKANTELVRARTFLFEVGERSRAEALATMESLYGHVFWGYTDTADLVKYAAHDLARDKVAQNEHRRVLQALVDEKRRTSALQHRIAELESLDTSAEGV